MHPPPTTQPAEHRRHDTPDQNISVLLGGADRIAVIDVETTGLYNKDRVVEIAIVTMDGAGNVIDEFDTLINPMRDVGPTWIHGISASMVRDAPRFEDIAGHVAARVHGAVCVAHNLRFDARMVGHEFARVGIAVDWGRGLDTLSVTRCKLGQACSDYDVPLDNAHRALADARATGQLMVAVAEQFERCGQAAQANPIQVNAMRIHTRDGRANADVPQPYLARLAAGLHVEADVAPYVALLDAAIADLKLTPEERVELADLAGDLGLTARDVDRAHRTFLDGLVDAAVADNVVTDEEIDQLCRAATLLDEDLDFVTRRTDTYRTESNFFELSPGLEVCFTGSALDSAGAEIDRGDLESLAIRHGLVPKSSVTAKGCGLLIAADVSTQSGKADKARQYGIPVASVDDFLSALRTGNQLTVMRREANAVVLVCVHCGSSWKAKRRSREPVCADCK